MNEPTSADAAKISHKPVAAAAPPPGSTLIIIDMYGCNHFAHNPEALHALQLELIEKHGMTPRAEVLDCWVDRTSGPCTSFRTLEDSHVSAESASAMSRNRAETWPEKNHINADIQLCNFNKDNRPAAEAFAAEFVERCGAKMAYLMAIQRGPGARMKLLWQRSLGSEAHPKVVDLRARRRLRSVAQ